jgi:hypothetical protein
MRWLEVTIVGGMLSPGLFVLWVYVKHRRERRRRLIQAMHWFRHGHRYDD